MIRPSTFAAAVLMSVSPTFARIDDPLLDWADWEEYRKTVKHPATRYNAGDLRRAKKNIERYDWARQYAEKVQRTADDYLKRMSDAFVINMIPETTPGEILFTPCPACRDQQQPKRHPHGSWDIWSADDPDRVQCKICKTEFPNEQYPEDVVVHTKWGKPQTFTYFGGEPMRLFSYKTARSSVSGHIRARKVQYMATAAERIEGQRIHIAGDIGFVINGDETRFLSYPRRRIPGANTCRIDRVVYRSSP